MRILLLAPVIILVTGACFATRNDMLILQQDVRNARLATEQQVAQIDQQQMARTAELERVLRSFMDSVRAFQTSFYNTGGNLADNQGKMQQNVEQLLARLDVFMTEQSKQGADINLLKEQFAAWRAVVVASDSSLMPPDPGPMEKMAVGKEQLAVGAFSTARSRFLEILQETTDSTVLSDAMFHVAESYFGEGMHAQADSVFQIVYRVYPRSAFAPRALYRHGVSLKNSMQVEAARVIFRRILAEYPTSVVAPLARDQLGGGEVVDTRPRPNRMN